ncbi:MAG: hypothetical protein P1R58_02940, partial [bacterium]|nr:hypothetical protein [bacterium]
MKRIAFFLTSLLILSFGLANAQSSISLDAVTAGAYPGDATKLDCNGGVATFEMLFDNQSGGFATGTTNGFRVIGPNVDASGSMWNPAIDWGTLYWDGGLFFNYFPGIGEDTIGFGNFKIFGTGYPSGSSDIA